ncbi:pyruvate/2-oxoglutarate dehydrogenase complex dehydrogenase (E1) component eukaryotic type beta subunit [Klebsiella pneumoniae]|uniref:Pyruvate/2-oxoglutarate dehydrogenase complex dehydrogenase (E1) component eukaryotic type beta subunit n=1 Tax=Klebsiella pneumoniae TaxID=573 RepID=A0A377UQX8_KLEPN|nr:pyruvate/2-oxoglutarate dehydrogenase complex dehydrogenase (E1) component eukaryotic type beta subunit [Klebsiella pneumoniae]
MSNFEQALERTDGKTLILSNGSKWAGQDPDSIQTLLDVLGDNVLTRCLSSITVIAHTRLNQW